MALGIKGWSATPISNSSVDGIAINENCPYANMNDGMRAVMAAVRLEVADLGASVAAAATPDISIDGQVHTVTGATTITGWATAVTGLGRTVWYETATPHTNSSALKCPGGANFTSAKGDVIKWRSFGAGNWASEGYQLASGAPLAPLTLTSAAAGTLLTLTSTEAGAADGPVIDIFRDSASPAVNDELGQINFSGRSSTAVKRTLGSLDLIYLDPTNASEDGNMRLLPMVAGAQVAALQASNGVNIGSPAAFKGTGALNAEAGVYIAGHGTVAQVVSDTEATYMTLGTILPADDTIPQNTEGDEILSVAITPTNASSILRFQVHLNVCGATGATISAALFVDSTANALTAAARAINSSTVMENLDFLFEVSAASTSARTYKIRAGAATATDGKLNGDNTARWFSGVAISSLVVTEVLPQ